MTRRRRRSPIVARVLATCALATCGNPSLAHPPRGIVVDGGNNVYFSDLERIWKISPSGKLTLVRPGVSGRHIHELAIDAHGSVYGEETSYDASRDAWPSAIWKLRPNRRVTYLVPTTREPDLGSSVWRDANNCTYLAQQEPSKGPLLFRRCSGRQAELLFGNRADAASYRQVLLSNMGGTAMGPDGSYYFRHGATVRKRTPGGNIHTVATRLPVENYGIAVASDGALLVAEHAARRVVSFAAGRRPQVVASSAAPWSPTGVYARSGALYVLEVAQPNPRTEPSFRVRRRTGKGRTETLATLIPPALEAGPNQSIAATGQGRAIRP
jgi:hypothetical protein